MMWQKSHCDGFPCGASGSGNWSLPPSHHRCWENLQDLTWFFPFSISRFVTFPNGSPSPITSASFMSLGSLRTWTTREGTPELRTSPLNFFVSLPLAAGGGGGKQTQADTIREGTEGSGLSWIMDWLSWQHKQTRQDKRLYKMNSPSMATTLPEFMI